MRTTDTPDTTTRRNWARLAMAGAVLGGVALLTAACGGASGSGSASTTTAGSGASTSSSAAAASGTQVTATLTEYHIALSAQTFTPGTYTFVTKNAGQVGHALEISGPGVSDQHTQGLQPGGTADLTVTLSAGSYDVFCPVPGHKSLGMDTTITVSGSGAGGAATQPTTTTQPTTSAGSGGGYGGGY